MMQQNAFRGAQEKPHFLLHVIFFFSCQNDIFDGLCHLWSIFEIETSELDKADKAVILVDLLF